jgi:hypothetical protein
MIGKLLLVAVLSLLSPLTHATPMDAKSRMYLRLDEPRDLLVEPYKLYEIMVPLSQLKAKEQYWIRTYYNGGQANDAVMKRKSI